MDLLEQQQAREQARLLNRFKELRNWQLQQQEMLMVQQRQQLAALQQEQQRVQSAISEQRHAQWGQSSPASPRKSSNTPLMSPLVSKRRQRIEQSSPPGSSSPNNTARPLGLPTPNLPEFIASNYPDHYTNPELFSNPEITRDPEGEGSDQFTIPDTASDNSDSSDAILPIKTLKTRLFSVDRVSPNTVNDCGTSARGNSPVAPDVDSDNDEDLERRYLEEEADEEDEEDEDDPYSEHDRMDGSRESGGEESLKKDAPISSNPDERPVSSTLAGSFKTFEQLIEEELQKEQKSQSSGNCEQSPSSRKHAFLRRGDGISRFNKPPARTHPRIKKITVTDSSSLTKRRNVDTKASNEPAKSRRDQKVPSKENSTRSTSANKTQPKKPAYSDAIAKLKLKAKKVKDTITIDPKSIQSDSSADHKHTNKQHPTDSDPTASQPTIQLTTVNSSNNQTSSAHLTHATYSDKNNIDLLPSVVGAQKSVSNIARSVSPHIVHSGHSPPRLIPDPSCSNSITKKYQEEEKMDQEDLEEFEMLEEFADNMSFTSNSSLVVRVLEKDKLKQTQSLSASTQNTLRPYLLSKQSQVLVNKMAGGDDCKRRSVGQVSDSDSSYSESSSDLSETDGEDGSLTPRASVELRHHSDQTDGNIGDSRIFKSDHGTFSSTTLGGSLNNAEKHCDPFVNGNNDAESNTETETETENDIFTKPKSPMKRKIAGRNIELSPIGTGSKLSHLLRNSVAPAPVLLDDFMNAHPLNGSDENYLTSQSLRNRGRFKSAESPSNLNSVHNRVSLESSSSNDGFSEPKIEANDLINDKNVENTIRTAPSQSVRFDDEQSWGDLTLGRNKQDSDSSDDERDTTITEAKPALDVSPGPSNLVLKLFPKLRSEKTSQQVVQQEKLDRAAQPTTILDGVQSKALREKLNELENEIKRFRQENAQLEVLRKEREEGIAKLKKEITDFEKEKTDELERLQTFKAEETKKLRHERKVFETYQKAARAGPDKKEREEIESLNAQLTEVQEELKRKESRWSASSGRMRSRIEELESENEELKEEIRILERSRLAWLQKEQAVTKSSGHLTSSLTYTNPTDEPTDTDTNSLPMENGYVTDDITKPKPKKLPSHKPQTSNMKKGQLAATKQQPVAKTSNQLVHNKNARDKHKPKLLALTKSPRVGQSEDVPRTAPISQHTQQQQQNDYVVGTCQPQQTTVSRKLARTSMDSAVEKGSGEFEETCHSDGKVERIYTDGTREVQFPNGTKKEISADGLSINVVFFNGDSKRILPDQRVIYYYADAKTTHTTYPDGLEVIQFPNNQTEKHYPDGTKEITFEDQTVKYLFANGNEESLFTDGTIIKIDAAGVKMIEFPNGQREIHTEHLKKREYPDGTVKTVYPDGRQETHYSNGRVRIKDCDGNVIVDKIV